MPWLSRPRTLITTLPNVPYENARVRDQSTTERRGLGAGVRALAQAGQALLHGIAQAGGQLAPQAIGVVERRAAQVARVDAVEPPL